MVLSRKKSVNDEGDAEGREELGLPPPEACIDRFDGKYDHSSIRCNLKCYSSSTLLIVLAISLLVRGFIAKALMPAAAALSASTR